MTYYRVYNYLAGYYICETNEGYIVAPDDNNSWPYAEFATEKDAEDMLFSFLQGELAGTMLDWRDDWEIYPVEKSEE